jgi:hypothetical protein
MLAVLPVHTTKLTGCSVSDDDDDEFNSVQFSENQ